MSATLEFEADNGLDVYDMCMAYAAGDTLIFTDETLSFLQAGFDRPKLISLGHGHEETRIAQKAEEGEPTAKVFRHLLNRCRVYHFHTRRPRLAFGNIAMSATIDG